MASLHKFEGLDALRGVLSIIVVIAHSWQVFIVPVVGIETMLGVTLVSLARCAVLLFFCLSGYVIALSITKNIKKNGTFKLFSYAKSRLMRVVPPLVFVFVSVYVATVVARRLGVDALPAGVTGARDVYSVDIAQQFNSLIRLCGIGDYDLTGILNGPLWSLKYEIQLYVIVGLGAAILFARGIVWRAICAGALCYYGYYALDIYLHYPASITPNVGGIRMQIVWFLAFGFGSVAFAFSNSVSLRALIGIMLGAMAISVVLFASSDKSVTAGLDGNIQLIMAQICFSVAGAAMVVLMSRISVPAKFAAMGNYSFTLYITHFPILVFGYFVVVRVAPHYGLLTGWILAIVGGSSCIWIAKGSYRLIEDSPAMLNLAIGRRLHQPMNASE